MPNSVCASSLRPDPTRPARPTISPALTVRLTPLVSGSAHEIARLEDGRADRRLRLRKEIVDPPPDHHLHELGGVGVADVARADIGAVAQHRDAIGDGEDLVEAMADVDDPDAAPLEAAHDVEQARHVAFGQRRGRLVHDEDARIVRQRAQDLDALPVADGQRADDLIGDEIVDFERIEQLLRLSRASRARSMRPAPACGAWPRKMFSATLSSGNSNSS